MTMLLYNRRIINYPNMLKRWWLMIDYSCWKTLANSDTSLWTNVLNGISQCLSVVCYCLGYL